MDTMPAPRTESPLPPSAATPLEPVTAAPISHLRRVHHAARATAATPGAARASQDFAAAMQALARGDFGASARQFDSFASTFPRDSRAEDALYLEAIALERAGQLLDARIMARRYVSVYPNGAHYAQALRIAGD
jgi:TolA-binding protein